jgi:surfeit locus 1 family protein
VKERRWVVLLAALLVAGVTARLGFWQLDRAAQKSAIQAGIERQRKLPALREAELPRTATAAAAERHRLVRCAGRWLAEHTVFLENRVMAGRAGFYVLTPLQLDDGAIVLVQRGWVARDPTERTRVPAPALPGGRVAVEGRIALEAARQYELARGDAGPIRQNLDLEAFARETGLALLPLVVVQEDGATPPADGLLRRWPQPAVDVHKNYGYAVQWFALCALVIALYVWFQLVRPHLGRRG